MDVLNVINIISEVVIIFAGIGGAVWGIYKLRKMRMNETKLEIEIIPAIYPTVKSKIVDVSIQLKNIGNVAIYSKMLRNSECLLEAKAIPDELEDSVIYWNDNNLLSLFPPIEFLKDFGYWGDPKNPYILEPGIAIIEHVIFSTRYDGIVFLKASFVDKEGYLHMTKKIVDLRVSTSPNSG